jgi:hypothetical protein
MRVSRYNVRVELETLTNQEGVIGDQYTTLANVWAKLEESETLEDATLIRTRWYGGLDRTVRILRGAQVYDVDRVIDSKQAHKELVFACHEVKMPC